MSNRRLLSSSGGSSIDWESIARGMIDCTTAFTIPAEAFGSDTSIGQSVIYGKKGLTAVIIPSTITSVGQSAFASCSALTSVTYEGSAPTFGTYVFQSCTAITDIADVLPSDITSLNTAMFMWCYGLTTLTIPSGITSLGTSCFHYCYYITSVTIPSSVTTIGGNCFAGDSAITEMIFEGTTPPTLLGTSNSLGNTSFTFPIYVPDDAVSAYQSATSWANYASRVTSINNRT